MKKVIKGRLCDTDTAKLIGEWDNGVYGSFDSISEALYLTKSGIYFIHGKGGPNTPYATAVAGRNWTGGESIRTLDYDAARKWAEESLSADEYIAHFEVPEDSKEKVPMTVVIKSSTKSKLESLRSQTGKTISTLIDEWMDKENV